MLEPFLGDDEVDILESSLVFGLTGDYAVHCAALQVKDVPQLLLLFQSDGVLHQHDVDRAEVFGLHGEDAKNLAEEGASVLFEVLSVCRH